MRKLAFSFLYLQVAGLVLLAGQTVEAQFEQYSVKAKWENYAVRERDFSVLFPRLPVVTVTGDSCRSEKSDIYAVYHDGAVYELRVTSKIKPGQNCTFRKNFDESNFSDRVRSLKTNFAIESIAADAIIDVEESKKTIKFINDYKNKRWFELTVYHPHETKKEAVKFLSSLKLGKDATGLEIGEGAEQTLGDDVPESVVDVETEIIDAEGKKNSIVTKQMLIKTNSKATTGIIIFLKPRANFTDEARQAQIQGTVVLRASFLANGAVGDVKVIRGLPLGLTEEAVKAAKKLVFMPQQKDGTRVSVTKAIEYSFKIY